MREVADADRIRTLAVELGKVAPEGTVIYLTGGATAVLEGWRSSTVDVDVLIEPESDAVLRRIAELKEELSLNVELASPLDFLPALPEWRERSPSRFREGAVTVHDFDLYSQALAKIERGFDLDLSDVATMVERGLVDPGRLNELFGAIESELFRFPAVDSPALREKVERLR
jgi:predicted nucleotidyltransferase